MLKIGKDISSFSTYSCKPNNKKELINAIKSRMYIEGPECDLNDIDVSLITDMSWLFYDSDFNGDISEWNVSNVVAMWSMFSYSKFDGDHYVEAYIIKNDVCIAKGKIDVPIRV